MNQLHPVFCSLCQLKEKYEEEEEEEESPAPQTRRISR
jgi:uncharacterized Zn finger protein (UPF0148 family)